MKLDGLMINKAKFSKMIEETVAEKSIPYIDAIVYLCEKHNIDIEDCKKFVSPIIKEKIEKEARGLNYLPRKKTAGLFDEV